jgi:hypothetical protein
MNNKRKMKKKEACYEVGQINRYAIFKTQGRGSNLKINLFYFYGCRATSHS